MVVQEYQVPGVMTCNKSTSSTTFIFLLFFLRQRARVCIFLAFEVHVLSKTIKPTLSGHISTHPVQFQQWIIHY